MAEPINFKTYLGVLRFSSIPLTSNFIPEKLKFFNFFKSKRNMDGLKEKTKKCLEKNLYSNCSWAVLFTCGDFNIVINFRFSCFGKGFIKIDKDFTFLKKLVNFFSIRLSLQETFK